MGLHREPAARRHPQPVGPGRTPGGSSGGIDRAVSAGMVPFGTASDGGGSIRTPASFTGSRRARSDVRPHPHIDVTQLAPTRSRFLATTVADTALLLDVMAGPDDA